MGTTFPTNYTKAEWKNHEPVRLFSFERLGLFWHYTDQPDDVVISGITYRAASITHDDLQRSDEPSGGELTVTCAEATPIVAALDFVGLSRVPVRCTIRSAHRLGTGGVTSGEAAALAKPFLGRVLERTIVGAECRFRLSSMASRFERPMLRISMSPECNNAIYDRMCGVNPALWSTGGCVVTAIAGRVLTVAEAALQPDPYYRASPLTIETGVAAGEPAFVVQHAGDQLTLAEVIPGLAMGDQVTIRKGCGGTEADCRSFNNVEYFLGFPRVPIVNPWDSVV